MEIGKFPVSRVKFVGTLEGSPVVVGSLENGDLTAFSMPKSGARWVKVEVADALTDSVVMPEPHWRAKFSGWLTSRMELPVSKVRSFLNWEGDPVVSGVMPDGSLSAFRLADDAKGWVKVDFVDAEHKGGLMPESDWRAWISFLASRRPAASWSSSMSNEATNWRPRTMAENLAKSFDPDASFHILDGVPYVLYADCNYVERWDGRHIGGVHPRVVAWNAAAKEVSEQEFRAIIRRIHGLE